MSRSLLNLGILAHVDAGKTTLTERLLHAAGVIDAVGSVDRGTTQTDTLALERARGISIKAAVVSFALGDVTVNLIDTPGHPDFIAEVERVLGVLDGAVLVVSAVEGVQPQTRVLWRALRRLRLPTLVFVNKTDRAGADRDRALQAIRARLTPAAVPVDGALLETLAERDDELLAAFVEGRSVPRARLRAALAEQTRGGLVHPVFFGSALKGDGVEALLGGIAELLPPDGGDPDGPLAATVFKIERGPAGEKIAYVRLFSGTLAVRQRVGERKVTGLAVFADGGVVERPCAQAGEIAKVRGLADVRVGDAIGGASTAAAPRFPPPTLEAVVVPRDPDDAHALSVALAQLAEQDPLIDARNEGGTLSLSLYGEVQREVVEATLRDDFGVAVAFRDATTIHVERPAGVGEALELLNAPTNPCNAELGLRVEPGPDDSGVELRLAVATPQLPLYVYKRRELFAEAMERYVLDGLRAGPHGWRVTDCVVTMTRCDYPLADGPPSRRGPMATAADYEALTPLVLQQALARAGTVVCEPLLQLALDVPAQAVGGVLRTLARLGATVEPPSPHGRGATISAVAPAARVPELQRLLPGLAGGEGVLETSFAGYQPVTGKSPPRRTTT